MSARRACPAHPEAPLDEDSLSCGGSKPPHVLEKWVVIDDSGAVIGWGTAEEAELFCGIGEERVERPAPPQRKRRIKMHKNASEEATR